MRKKLLIFVCIVCMAWILGVLNSDDSKGLPLSTAISRPAAAKPTAVIPVNVDYTKIPIYFIPNQGQVHPDVLYYAATPEFKIWVTGQGLVFDQIRDGGGRAVERSASRLTFIGARPHPTVHPDEAAAGRVNYFRGQDPSGWITDIPTSRSVIYEGLYDKVDLKIYGKGRQVEYDWSVRPGGRVSAIGFRYENVKASRVNNDGDLEVETDFGKLIHSKPYCYQPIGGQNIKIAARFATRSDGSHGFEVGAYDPSYPLVIDPVVLIYSTYLGGASADAGCGIALDSSGAAYVAGYSASLDYPVFKPFQKKPKGLYDVVVTKINPKGDGLIYSTYLGGSASDFATDIAVDKSGNAYITGYTDSANFPVRKPFQGKLKGSRDIFVTKLNPQGNGLVYSTYLGGSQWESGEAIAVDSKGSAYITGNTISSDFPLKNPYQKFPNPSFPQIAYVTKLHPDGNKLVYSTYLGGSKGSMGTGICVDGNGSAFVIGFTTSDDFPVKNPLQATRAGWSDTFVTKFNPQGSDLEFSTYYGGSADDIGNGIAVAANGAIYLTGSTDSTNLPTVKPLQSQPGGLDDVFVAKLNPKGSALLFSTYLGGSNYDCAYNLAFDQGGNCYLVGETYSRDFPVRQALQKTLRGTYDAFVTKINASGSAMLYSTYLGGSIENRGNDIAVGADRSAYVAGQTYSLDFPLKNPIQSAKKGGLEGFVAKIK